MNPEEYTKQREALMAAANSALEAGNIEEANVKMNEVKELDSQQESSAVAQANLAALSNQQAVTFPPGIDASAGVIVGGVTISGEGIKPISTVDYEEVFAKVSLGRKLTTAEAEEYTRVNNVAYVHQAKDQPIVIPETTIAGIMKMVGKVHQFFGDVPMYGISGKITFRRHASITSDDKTFIDESEESQDIKNTFAEIKLDGFEVAKIIRVSFKLESMSIKEFIPFIQNALVEKIGNALGNQIFIGTGTNEPEGLLVTLSSTAQVFESEKAGVITYKDLTKMRSLIASQFSAGIKFYATSTTIWNQLANVVDETGRPVFIKDPVAGGVGTIFGIPVVEEDGVPNNELVLGAPKQGMVGNINEQLRLETGRELTKRENIFLAYMIIDWTVTYIQAFSHLKVKAGE